MDINNVANTSKSKSKSKSVKSAPKPLSVANNPKVTRISASDSANKKPTKKVETPDISATAKELKKPKNRAANQPETASTVKLSAKKTKLSKGDSKKPKADRESQPSNIKRDGFIGYFTGAWYELRQVRWPNRKATVSLTIALLGFTAFFVVIILLLDAGFQYLFKLLLA